jgi:1-aminocyclopropane-1-carboxylate deaminase/D-cysteine desulfhydrase-like pyridoxal-dependent ACC family enzyme
MKLWRIFGAPARQDVTALTLEIESMTQEGWEALQLLATTEGILLDPVYTAKAMTGLIHDAREGRLSRDDIVVFLHMGGLPAVFAYRDGLLSYRRPS